MRANSMLGIFSLILSFSTTAAEVVNSNGDKPLSEAHQRYISGELEFEKQNPLFPTLTYHLTTGLGYEGNASKDPIVQKVMQRYRDDPNGPHLMRLFGKHKDMTAAYHLRHGLDGFTKNTTFRDPSSPIKVGNTYHIWYSKSWGTPPVGQKLGSQQAYQDIKGKWQRIYSWDYVSIWHATSKDGIHWQEQKVAIEPGPAGSYDDRNVFTPDILVANGKYYLYYQVASSPHVYRQGPHSIAVAEADSPFGPWKKSKAPILLPSEGQGFDSRKVHDPSLIVKGGRYYLYYKGDGNHDHSAATNKPVDIGWGLAISDSPLGPFKKVEQNPVVLGGHEVVIFPHKSGVCGMIRQGPEIYTLQCADDGINFSVKSHLTDVPYAGTFFRQGNFKDIDKFPAKLPRWGLSHVSRLGSKETSIVHYDIKFNQRPAL